LKPCTVLTLQTGIGEPQSAVTVSTRTGSSRCDQFQYVVVTVPAGSKV